MRVVVVSDTHIPERAPALPPKLVKDLCDADLILHLGDFTAPELLDELETYAETQAVCGNCDPFQLCQRLPEKQILEVAGKRIGMMHGRGTSHNLLHRVRQQFEDVDVVLFGHSHQALVERSGGILYANPGSPTDNLFSPRRTYLRLQVGEKIEPEIVEL
jgi:putative phosphoesterase